MVDLRLKCFICNSVEDILDIQISANFDLIKMLLMEEIVPAAG